MKITKRQLRRIIREERTRLLHEQGDVDAALDDFNIFVLDVAKGKTQYSMSEIASAVKEAVTAALYEVEVSAGRLDLDVPFKQLAAEAVQEM